MEEALSKIKDLHLHVDSQSAVEIANAYIQYKYFTSILAFVFLTFVCYGTYKLAMKTLNS